MTAARLRLVSHALHAAISCCTCLVKLPMAELERTKEKQGKTAPFCINFNEKPGEILRCPGGHTKQKDGPTALPHFHGIWDYHLRHSGLRDCSRTEICACSSHDALCFVFGILQIWSSPPIHEKCNFCHSQKTLRYAPEAVEPDKSCQSNFWKMENLFDITA